MRLEDFQYFRAVATERSLNQAASSLYISQPSLSNAMARLEEELGVQLFIRSSRGITLTSEGEEFLQYANQIMEQVALMERRYNGHPDPVYPYSPSSPNTMPLWSMPLLGSSSTINPAAIKPRSRNCEPMR